MYQNGKKFQWASLLAGFGLLLGMFLSSTPAQADYASESKALVSKALLTFEDFAADPQMSAFRNLVKKSRGILICPEVFKGAFVLGASGGSGVLIARQGANAPWAGPSFYTLGELSFGLQAGADVSEVILLAMTERGVTAFLGNSFKLGGNVSIAAGPVGGGVSADTANLSADILSFSMAKGLYGGISLNGSVVAVREGLNDAYYKKEVRPSDILIRQDVKNPQADELIAAVEKMAGR